MNFSFSYQHPITDRLALHPLTIADATSLFYLVEQNRTILSSYLYWVDSVVDIASAKRYISQRIQSDLPNATWLKIVVGGEVAGVFGIKYIEPDTKVAEVGYWLTQYVQGQGIMSEIVSYIQQLFRYHQISTLRIKCLAENTASIKVAEKSGASLVSVEPDAMKMNGQWQALLTFEKAL